MPAVEVIYWVIASICIVVRLFGRVYISDNVSMAIWAIAGMPLLISSTYIFKESNIDLLLRVIKGTDIFHYNASDLEPLINKIESGQLDASKKQLQYLKSSQRIISYGFIPIVVLFILNVINDYSL